MGAMFEHYDLTSRKAVFHALQTAKARGGTSIATEHLLLGLAQADPGLVAAVHKSSGSSGAALAAEIDRLAPAAAPEGSRPDLPLAPDALEVLRSAAEGGGTISTRRILGALLQNPGVARTALLNVGIQEQHLP